MLRMPFKCQMKVSKEKWDAPKIFLEFYKSFVEFELIYFGGTIKLYQYENVNGIVFTSLIITITFSSPHPCYLLPLISKLYTCDSKSQDNLTCHGPPTNMMGIIIYASLVNYVWVEIAKLQKCAAVNFIRISDNFYLRNFVLQN